MDKVCPDTPTLRCSVVPLDPMDEHSCMCSRQQNNYRKTSASMNEAEGQEVQTTFNHQSAHHFYVYQNSKDDDGGVCNTEKQFVNLE